MCIRATINYQLTFYRKTGAERSKTNLLIFSSPSSDRHLASELKLGRKAHAIISRVQGSSSTLADKEISRT